MLSRALLLIFTAFLLPAQSSDEKDVLAVVQRVFDGIGAHDGAMIRGAMLPEARVGSVRDAAAPSASTGSDLADRIASTPGPLQERFTSAPQVQIHGRMAQVWGEYEFLRDGKFSHCGVDSFNLLKVDGAWKISVLVFTAETSGCKGH